MKRLNRQYSPKAICRASLAPCPQSTGATYTSIKEEGGETEERERERREEKRGRIEAFVGLDFDYRASLIAKYGLPA